VSASEITPEVDLLQSQVAALEQLLEVHERTAREQAVRLEQALSQARQHAAELEEALRKLKAAQDQLIVQQKLASLGTLTAGIAHEVKNPLNFVTNFAQLSGELIGELEEELAKQQELIPPPAYDNLTDIVTTLRNNSAKIREHGQRADGIVRGMLMHSRAGSGDRQPTDLNALLAQYCNLAYHGFRAQDNSFNVTFENDYDPSLGMVRVVAQDVGRVFLNIISNACYAIHEKSKTSRLNYSPMIRLTTRKVSDQVEIRIRDNGTGVPGSIRDKLFQPFFTTKPPGSGTGLGLSISYDIVVRGHQGNIAVDSEDGKYAEFVITLPMDANNEFRQEVGRQ
jgi:signal transduction histidine kinase